MSSLHTYLPQDRLRALARNETLPDRTSGSALFADISGFTALTEGLRETLGARQGGEELSKQLGVVYTALINEVEKYGGSVLSFAGDAITCWFDETLITHPGHTTAAYAVQCALSLQQAMQAFHILKLANGASVTLTLKVAVATGAARRFVVGDPAIQLLDTIVGATVTRTSGGEQLANKAETLIDEATAKILDGVLTLTEWRTYEASGEKFGVVTHYLGATVMPVLPPLPTLPTDLQVQPWLDKVVYERETSGAESFLTEFRPCTIWFVRFSGIAYEVDDAQLQLDTFIRHLQKITTHYDGSLLQLTIGDKGSYAYLNFGALSAHEDDARRAVKAALELITKTDLRLQMGIAQGVMRVGAYGGQTRQTFGALGDEVNLAARLMTTATTGEVLVSGAVHKAVAKYFSSEPRPPLAMKGKAEPLPVFAVTSERKHRAIRLQEPTYALPMVGREKELQILNDKLDLVLEAKGQVLGIVAEAGLGKSRLVAEMIRLARKKGFTGFGGACQSDAINTPYQAWKSIWQAFFEVDHESSLKKQMRNIEAEIEDRVPERVPALPLLKVVLDLEIPDNDFTQTLEPKYRKSALQVLLEECLRAAAKDEPLLIVIEDLHWIDALSRDLLEELARALSDSRICFVLAYRPPQSARATMSRFVALPNFSKIELGELNPPEAESAIRAKLAQLYPARGNALPLGLVDKLMMRAQGNPFYLEELLNYLHDRSIDPSQLDKIELPDSLHTLILSRIDTLSEREKTTLRVASIVGRLFRANWLTGYYPELGAFTQVKTALDALDALEITPLESTEPELAYLFKHIVTHEVTYESLPFATRAKLHEQLARYLEANGAAADTIAYHYGHSDNAAKKREYYQKAVDAADMVSAFDTVVEYLTRLLDLTPKEAPIYSALALKLADAHYRLGNYPVARAAIEQAQATAQTDADRAAALAFLGDMTSNLGNYAAAQTMFIESVPLARNSNAPLVLSRVLSVLGYNYWRLGKLDEAKVVLNESLTLACTLGDVTRELFVLNALGAVAFNQGDVVETERLWREVHTRAVAVGNRERVMLALNNLGAVARLRKDNVAMRDYIQQALALAREIGVQDKISLFLLNLIDGDIALGDFSAARKKLREGLTLALRLGVLPRVVTAVLNFGVLAHAEGQTERALALIGLARKHPAWSSENQRGLDATFVEWALDPSVVETGMEKGEALDWDATVKELLK